MTGSATGRAKPRGAWINLPALLAVVLWGIMVPYTKVALAEFPAMPFTALRCLLAAAILFLLLRLRGVDLGVAHADWPRLVAAGTLAQGSFMAFTLLGLQYTTATHNILLFSTSPIVGALALWALGRYRPTPRAGVGILLGFAGVALLVGSGDDRPGGATLLGDALTLLGTLGWVGLTVIPQRLTARYGALLVTAWLQLLSAAAIAPLALPALPALVAQPPALGAWLALLYSVVAGSVIAYSLWQHAVQALGSTGTLVYGYLEPLVTILIAVWFLHEPFGPIQAGGAVVLLLGVALAQRG